MYVMALVDFHDNLKGIDRKCGEEFVVTKARFEEINAVGEKVLGAPIVSVVQREPLSPEGKKAARKAKKG